MTDRNQQEDFQVLNQLRKELRITRIFCAISSLLTLFLLIGGIFVVNKVQNYMTEITPVVEKVSELDVEGFNQTLENVNVVLASVDWEKLSASLSELDVEALNAAIADLDTAELSEALTNLNDAADTLEEVSKKLTPITSVFGK